MCLACKRSHLIGAETFAVCSITHGLLSLSDYWDQILSQIVHPMSTLFFLGVMLYDTFHYLVRKGVLIQSQVRLDMRYLFGLISKECLYNPVIY